MRNCAIALFCLLLAFLTPIPCVQAVDEIQNPAMSQQTQQMQENRQGEITELGYRSGRGSFSGGRSPGAINRGGTAVPGRNPANVGNTPRTPTTTTPARGGWGGLFGGFAAGALLGSILNPFGFMGFGPGAGSPFSIIGLLFWGVIIYLVYRLFTRARKNQS